MDSRVEQLRTQLREDPSSRLFFQLGELLRKDGQLEEATTILRDGLEHHPRYVAAWVALGRALLSLNHLEEGEGAFGKALELDPENVVAARMIGRAAGQRHDWVRAIKALKLARALSPRDEELEEEIRRVETELANEGRLQGPGAAGVSAAEAGEPAGACEEGPGSGERSEQEPFGSVSEPAGHAASADAAPPLETAPLPILKPSADVDAPSADPFDVPSLADEDPFGDLDAMGGSTASAQADADASDVFDIEVLGGGEPVPAGDVTPSSDSEPAPADDADAGYQTEAGSLDDLVPRGARQPGAGRPSVARPSADIGLSLETDPFFIVDDGLGAADSEAAPVSEDDVFGSMAFDEPLGETAAGDAFPEAQSIVEIPAGHEDAQEGARDLEAIALEAMPAASDDPLVSEEPSFIDETVIDQPEVYEPELERASVDGGAGDLEEAASEPFAAEAVDADLPFATPTLARLAIEQGDLDLARRTIDSILLREPENRVALQLREQVSAQLAEAEKAAAPEHELEDRDAEPATPLAVGAEQRPTEAPVDSDEAREPSSAQELGLDPAVEPADPLISEDPDIAARVSGMHEPAAGEAASDERPGPLGQQPSEEPVGPMSAEELARVKITRLRRWLETVKLGAEHKAQ